MKKFIATTLILLIINVRANAGLSGLIAGNVTSEGLPKLSLGSTFTLVPFLFMANNGEFEKFVMDLTPEEKITLVATKDEALYQSSNEYDEMNPSGSLLKIFAILEERLQGKAKSNYTHFSIQQKSEVAFEVASYLEAL